MEMQANKRLIKLAAHLERIKYPIDEHIMDVWIEWPENNFNTWYSVKYNAGLFKEMPNWFDDWQFGEEWQEPELKNFENLGFGVSCMRYFFLTAREFSHLFDTEGHQNIIHYGGEIINDPINAKLIALNIRELVKNR